MWCTGSMALVARWLSARSGMQCAGQYGRAGGTIVCDLLSPMWVLLCARRGQRAPCDPATYALSTELVGRDKHIACGGIVGGELGEDRRGGHVRGVRGDLRHRHLGCEVHLHDARLGWLGRLRQLSVGTCSRAQHGVRGRKKNEKRKMRARQRTHGLPHVIAPAASSSLESSSLESWTTFLGFFAVREAPTAAARFALS